MGRKQKWEEKQILFLVHENLYKQMNNAIGGTIQA